jgi:transcriptional regulator with XRE-family HTH domain
VETYRCAECDRELVHFGEDLPPTRCEDCFPETGPGSRLADQFAVNLHQLRRAAGLTGGELSRRAGMSNPQEVFQYERDDVRGEPGLARALRLAHSLGASLDQLTNGIYWNPGEIARRPGDRRPPSERLSGFFLVPPASEAVVEPAPLRGPVSSREEAARIFGQNLRDARGRRHLTQTALAGAAGLSKAGLSLIERGIRETTIETLLSLARALEVAPESLLAGITWKPEPPPRAPLRGGAHEHAAGSLDGTIKDLWLEDKTAGEIAAVIGTSQESVSAIVHRLRERGEHLPYRRPPTRAVHEGARLRRGPRIKAAIPDDHAGEEIVDTAGISDASNKQVAARLGANVAFYRKRAGLTLRELGEAAETDKTRLHHLENGKWVPRIALVVKLAASFNIRCCLVASGVTWEPDRGAFRLEAADHEATLPATRLGQNVVRARRRIKLTQEILSVSTSMSRGDVVDFERGNRNFRLFTVVRLAGGLGVDFADLFSGVVDWYVRPLPAPEYAAGVQPPTKSERDAILVRLWRCGAPEREIAEALDLTIGAVGPYVRELRDAGEDLAYRRPPRRASEAAARLRRKRHRSREAAGRRADCRRGGASKLPQADRRERPS